MADQKTTDAAISSLVVTYYEKKALERLVPNLRFDQGAEKKPLPKNNGKTIQFYRYRNLTAVTTPLSELTTPSQVYLSADTVSVGIVERGAYAKFSTLLADTAIDPQVADRVDVFGDHAALSYDTYIRNRIGFFVIDAANRSTLTDTNRDGYATSGIGVRVYSGVSTGQGFPIYANKTRLTSSATVVSLTKTAMSVKTVMHAASILRNKFVQPMSDGNYLAFMHPTAIYQLKTSVKYNEWLKYTSDGQQKLYRGEVATIDGVRIVESPNAPAVSLTGDTLDTSSGKLIGTIIVGKGAYGVTTITGTGMEKGFKIFVKKPNNNDTSQPVDIFSTVGWKITAAANILNKSAGVIVLTTSIV